MIIAFGALRLWVAGHTQLAEDEAYYWMWARDLQWSYFDHPAMTAWWIAAGVAWLGVTELGVRLPVLLSAALVSWLAYDSGRIAFDSARVGLYSAFWLNVTLLFGAGAVLVTPDAPLLLFWALTLWSLLKLIEQGRARWLLLAGLSLGLGMLSKYTIALMVPGVLLCFVLFPALRRWWRGPWLYLAAALAALASSPILIWNLQHHWASFDKQWSHAFAPQDAKPLQWFGDFVASQAGLITPLIFLFCLWGMLWALRHGWRERRPAWFLLGTLSLPVLLFFLERNLSVRVQPNWPGPLYLPAIIAAVGAFEHLRGRQRVAGWLCKAYLLAPWLGLALTLMVYTQAVHPWLPIPQRLDATHRLDGWTTLGAAIDTQRQRYPDAFLLTTSHNITGVISFYSQGQPAVYQRERIRYPYLGDADYAALPGRAGIYVTRVEDDQAAEVAKHFDRFTRLQDLSLTRAGESFAHFRLYLGESYRGGLL